MKWEEIKSVRTAYLFWLVGLCGCLGVHRMYLGKRRTARLWLCTAGVLGVGALADAFLPGCWCGVTTASPNCAPCAVNWKRRSAAKERP